MGQYWQILNLDTQQTHGFWGKLGEFFTSSAPEILVQDIRIPRKVSFENIISATQSAYTRQAEYKSKRLLHRDYQNSDDELGLEIWIPEGRSLLVDLPPEIAKLLFGSIDTLRHAICLGLTCKRLLELGLDRIDQLLSMSAAHWAGDRLICIGDYARNDDMPPGMLTEEERAFLEDEDIKLYEYARNYSGATDSRWYWLLAGDYDFVGQLSPIERAQYRAIVYTADKGVKDAVLCNLSKREYLRHEAVKAHGHAGFGNFLLSRICWSSDGSVSMCYEGDIHRGVWAGDRFEIVSIDALEGGANSWKDVSDEMGKEMAAIWESEYGPDWQEQRS
ncbi:hypothetical protein FRB94_014690 [Tulasnella sp. JGI-2019a]|nr:hypothetical protein FRB93_007747 [Tulasnella sp. JGI-2019a]KAG8989066.1 hypothetical protein FRB94_014690 [Tulasnella sp. JGI-2019a]KAG9027480.1 hypothetical protein FRB95_007660 [Tulasnella sp. JGI-2019a]